MTQRREGAKGKTALGRRLPCSMDGFALRAGRALSALRGFLHESQAELQKVGRFVLTARPAIAGQELQADDVAFVFRKAIFDTALVLSSRILDRQRVSRGDSWLHAQA